MVDLMDDDFGDLYADVEIQANANLCAQSLGNEHDQYHTEKEEEESLASGSKEFKDSSNGENLGNSDEDDGEESDDTEDDLNIVLNDEDCKGFSVTNINGNGGGGCEKEEGDGDGEGEDGGVNNGVESTAADGSGNGAEGGGYILQHLQNKNVRSYRSSFPTNKKGNEYAGMVSHFSNAARGDCYDTGCMQHNISNLGQVAKFRATANSAVVHGGYPFSLPWYRTILDVNIDAFEDKRWRHPGVNISDFFNFGFNEDSWKQYCISLEQFQQQSYMNSKLPIHQSPKLTKAYEIRSQYNCVAQEAVAKDALQVGSSSKCPDGGEKQLVLPKGQAIQVEDGTGERQPTMDLECPLVWDSDVVIQINVQDSKESFSHSSEEKVGHEDGSAHRASESRDLNVDDIRDAFFPGSAGRDELSAESLEGNLRCSKAILECNKMSHDPDNETNQISDVDGYFHEKENAHSAEDLAEAMEIGKAAEEEIGRNICELDQFLNEPELSLADNSYFIPGLSFSGSDSETSRDTVSHVLKESPSALSRPSSVTGLQESVMSDHKNSKSNGIIGKSGIQNCSRHESPIWERQKHQNGRLHGVPGRRIHCDDENDATIIRKGCSPHGRSRSIEKLHDSDYESRDNFSYHRRRDSSRDHSGERFGKNQVVYRTKYHRKYHWRFRHEVKPRNRSGWNEKKHLNGRSSRLDNRDTRRDSFRFRRGLSPKDTIPTHWKSRRLISRYNNYKKMHFRQRRNCKNIQVGKRTFHGSYFLNHKNEGDLMREKCGRSVSSANHKRFPLDEKCGRQSLFDGREVNLSGRRVTFGDDPDMDLDNSCYTEIEDEYRNPHHHHFSSRSQQESYASDEVRWRDMVPSRSDMLSSRLNERYGRHRRQIWDGEDRDGCWVGSCNDSADGDDIVYPDDQVPLQRNYSWQSGVLHWTQDESILRHHGDECYVERKSCSYGVASSNERIHTKHRAANGEALVDDIQLKPHNYKWMREEASAKYVSRTPTLMHEGSDEKEVGRCSDPVDLILGEGKVKLGKLMSKPHSNVPSSERCSNGGSLIREGKFEKVDLKFPEEKKQYKTRKATLANFPKSEDDDENCLDKFQVNEHNKESDVEDGQIVAEESNMEGNLEKKRASETAVLTRDVKKRNFHTDNASSGNENTGGYDNQLLLDVMVKMEKRRERFKDTVAAEKRPDKTPNPQVDLTADTVQTNQERRPRKRRWGGN